MDENSRKSGARRHRIAQIFVAAGIVAGALSVAAAPSAGPADGATDGHVKATGTGCCIVFPIQS